MVGQVSPAAGEDVKKEAKKVYAIVERNLLNDADAKLGKLIGKGLSGGKA